MITNNNIYDNMEEFNKLLLDPKFIDFVDGTECLAYQVNYGDIKFVMIMN
jgi:hypothetical protein